MAANLKVTGEIITIEADLTFQDEQDHLFKFGHIQLICDAYFWFVNEDRISDEDRALMSQVVDERPGLLFVSRLEVMLQRWRTGLSNAGDSYSLFIGFFDEMTSILKVVFWESDAILSSHWSPQVHGYFDHPLNLQREYGDCEDLDLRETGEPQLRVAPELLDRDLERVSAQLNAWIRSESRTP